MTEIVNWWGAAPGWIAQLVFWALLMIGFAFQELSAKSAGVFLALWVLGYVGLPRIPWMWNLLFTPYVAVLDIVLVALVLKGDVRLS